MGSCFTPFQKLLVIKNFSFTVVIYHLIENQTKVGHSYSHAGNRFSGCAFFISTGVSGMFPSAVTERNSRGETATGKFSSTLQNMMKTQTYSFFAILICVLHIFRPLLTCSIAFVDPGRRILSGM